MLDSHSRAPTFCEISGPGYLEIEGHVESDVTHIILSAIVVVIWEKKTQREKIVHSYSTMSSPSPGKRRMDTDVVKLYP